MTSAPPAKLRDEADVLALIAADPWMMDALRAAAALSLPDWWIGAGFVRARVWDALHGYVTPTPLEDVDVIYFDPGDPTGSWEAAYEAHLAEVRPGVPWSVRNQARMHELSGDRPYKSSIEAVAHWLETATAVVVTLDPGGRPKLAAPHGLDDLLQLRVRPTPSGHRRPRDYRARLAAKNWRALWPRLTIELP